VAKLAFQAVRGHLDLRRQELRTSTLSSDHRGPPRRLLVRFWRTASRYWSGKSRTKAWGLSGGLLLVILLLVAAAYAINLWNRAIFDGLQTKDASAVARLSVAYCILLAVSVALSLAQTYLRMALQRRWREWLNDRLVDHWISHGRHYQLNLVRGDHANPEYRIADDVRIASESPVDFVSGITQAVLSAMTFIAVLWTIGGALDVTVAGINLHVPGFLVVAAVLYAVIASGAMVLIGSRFVRVSERKNQAEAEYRYQLTRLRENGESIALIHGEEEERAGVSRSLQKVMKSWASVAAQTMRQPWSPRHRATLHPCCRSSCARRSFSTVRCRAVK
jgi:vitamin B12/bleomycin/antimicrobial peptide transport system ATP-binding/permease protein